MVSASAFQFPNYEITKFTKSIAKARPRAGDGPSKPVRTATASIKTVKTQNSGLIWSQIAQIWSPERRLPTISRAYLAVI
jgi:hypothetical protein